MSPEEPMIIDERRKYLHKMKPLYHQATRSHRSTWLTEMQAVTDLHRKSLFRLFHNDLRRKPRPSGLSQNIQPRRDARERCAEALGPLTAKSQHHQNGQ